LSRIEKRASAHFISSQINSNFSECNCVGRKNGRKLKRKIKKKSFRFFSILTEANNFKLNEYQTKVNKSLESLFLHGYECSFLNVVNKSQYKRKQNTKPKEMFPSIFILVN
jgi:hypothetical protein